MNTRMMTDKTIRHRLAVAMALVSPLVLSAPADAATRVRIRGTVEGLDANSLKVKTQDGRAVAVTLAPEWGVRGRYKVTEADIKPGDFVGIASQPTDTGINGAIEVVVFPPAMKGTGEGDRAWSGKPNSTMTNATVSDAVTSVNGPTLTLTYRGGERKVTIPPGTPIVALGPATKQDVKAGASVQVSGEGTGDNAMTSLLVEVDESGPLPPK